MPHQKQTIKFKVYSSPNKKLNHHKIHWNNLYGHLEQFHLQKPCTPCNHHILNLDHFRIPSPSHIHKIVNSLKSFTPNLLPDSRLLLIACLITAKQLFSLGATIWHPKLYFGEEMKFEAGILGRLTNLRRLPFLNVGEERGPAIKELGGLNQLRDHLIINGLEGVRDGEEAKKARLVQKSHLSRLTFVWTDNEVPNENQTDVLDGLEPHANLLSLTIGNFMGARFPSWISAEGEVVVFPCLEQLRIDDCPSLESIRITQGVASLRQLKISYCEALSSLEVGLDYCISLQELEIDNCRNLVSIPTAQGMPSLRKLNLVACEGLSSLGSGLNYCTSLQELEIKICDNLTSIPITQGITSLRRLTILCCERLLSLPSGLQFCTSLEYLYIKDCSSLVSISVSYVKCDHPDSTNQPEEISQGVDAYLSLQEEDCPSLESIPPNLRHLLICHCGKLKYVPTGGFHRLTRLKTLTIGPFWHKLDAFPDFQLPPNSQLEYLRLDGWPKLKSLPQQIQHFTCLKELQISFFKGLEALPEWLGNLTSLEALRIWHCENLKYLPTLNAMKNLTKLEHLVAVGCPLLKERCNKETGPRFLTFQKFTWDEAELECLFALQG